MANDKPTDDKQQAIVDARLRLMQRFHDKMARSPGVADDTRFTEEQTTLKEVFPVGRYGLTPSWGDGHDTGIYTFKMLRRASGLE